MSPSVFDPRLEYVTVAETALSDIDGERGELVVGGYPIDELATNATYEEGVFLLFEGRLPTAEELADFRADLASRRELPPAVRELLERAAETGNSAMDAIRMGVAAATLETDETDPRTAAERVVAIVPTIVATYWRYRQGEEPIEPRDDLGHAANYLYMLTGEEPTEAETPALETFLVTLLEHGLNPSTFTARTVMSTESDLVSAVTAAVGTFKGPRHGGGLELTVEMLRAVHDSGNGERYVRERLDAGERIKGFGHPVYQVRDPRATVLSAATERLVGATGDDGFLETVREFETVAGDVLAERAPERGTEPNVEFYAAALLRELGLPTELFTATFAVSRVGGWAAHCLEQRETDDLVRPTSQYVGASETAWTPVENRHVAGDSLVRNPVRSTALEPVSETLAVLSEPDRLELLLLLADRDDPVAYSTLRASSSIEDKGRFNYHLRQLRDYFVVRGEDGYGLTDAGRSVVETVLTDERLLEDLLD
ncbi:citrate/2-methylcitrate synthase [Natrinema sp. 1APR25-10V2]|uniref:citrate/2-methylcitrate synthase n=1 Tax=Natrinema sp. 1APR25-10V2 TaxID=2951081 RepID=UPI0028771E9A|nr:citrate/2-methylcitrate synthase [Natrinema sp. 1APR25-10V2]MDS0476761.1 citrate (Si)-synthase [Natrinema sp. 1APR25-10V2]